MNDEFGVNTLTLKTEIDSVTAELQSIRTDIETLLSAFQALDSMWDGEASRYFIRKVLGNTGVN